MAVETQSAVAEISKRNDVIGEPDMEAYARQRSGQDNPIEKESAAITSNDDAADATEDTAANTDDSTDVEQQTEASATTEDVHDATDETTVKVSERAEKRAAKLTARAKEAEALAKANDEALAQARREAEETKAELDRLKHEAAELARAAVPIVAPVEEDPTPQRVDFDDPDDFAIALSKHAAREAIRQSSEAARLAAEQRANDIRAANDAAMRAKADAAVMDMHKTFHLRIEKAKADLPDFEEKVLKNESVKLDNPVFFAIEQSEVGPHILYYLADNPSEADKLNNLQRTNPLSAAMRLGEIQAEVKAASKPKASKAAAPITPIRNRSNPDRPSLDEMSVHEYEKAYLARKRAEYERDHPNRARRAH